MLILDAVSPIERIKLSGQLASKIAALGKSVPALERVKLARDVAAILKELGASAAEAADLVFDLANPEATKASLSAYLADGLSSLPESLRACEAATIAELAKQIGASELMWQAQGLAGELRNAFGPAFAEMSGRGLSVDIDSDALRGKLDEALAISKQLVTDDPEWQAAQATLRQLNTSIRETANSIYAQLKVANQAAISAKANGSTDAQDVAEQLMADLHAKLQLANAEYGKAFGAAEKAADARRKSFSHERAEKANAIVRAEGEAVVEAIKAKSPISAEQAMTWAQAQKVEDSAFKRMAKNGYPKAQVLQDLADFYQISGGKASAISLVNTGSRRAYASNINTSDREKIIAIDTNFNRTILFHELAHHLENDPIAKAAANGYIEKRRESTKLYSLRSLTGNRGFGPREAAYKDDFLDAYMGKVYPDKSTEVFSMAVQYLANPLDAARMYAKDPELFAMVSGYLGSDLTPAMKARLGLHAGKIEEKADLEQQASSAIAEAASGVLLTASKWFEDFRAADDWKARYAVGRAGGDGEKMKTVGAYPQLGLYVIEGPVRTGGRGRRSKGFIVLRDTGGYPDAVFAGRSLDEAKAMVAAAIKLNGDLIAAKATYFGQGATPEAIAALKQLSQKGA